MMVTLLLAVVKLQENGNNLPEVRKFNSLGKTIWRVVLEEDCPLFQLYDQTRSILASLS